MKKWFIIIIIPLALVVAFIYAFFPGKSNSTNIAKINCKVVSLNRFLLSEDKWKKWWPGTNRYDELTQKNIFAYNGYDYTITNIRYNSVDVQTIYNNLIINGTIFLIPLDNNNVEAEWKYSLETNNNPINRIHLYLTTKKVNDNITGILNHFKSFFEKNENIYGLTIDQMLVKDTILISSKFSSAEYPSIPKIYEAIDSLKNYISVHKAKETNYPMLHVWKDSGVFKTTLAIPINVAIIENKNYSIKRMVPGKILVTEVKGGVYTANEALKQLELFMSENRLSSPAISFESLVTNRMEEKDTSKWITKIYYPVF